MSVGFKSVAPHPGRPPAAKKMFVYGIQTWVSGHAATERLL